MPPTRQGAPAATTMDTTVDSRAGIEERELAAAADEEEEDGEEETRGRQAATEEGDSGAQKLGIGNRVRSCATVCQHVASRVNQHVRIRTRQFA